MASRLVADALKLRTHTHKRTIEKLACLVYLLGGHRHIVDNKKKQIARLHFK
jgi:hypothetical protein